MGDFWNLAGTSLYSFNSTSEDNEFLEGLVYLFKWTHKDGPSLFASYNTVRATPCDRVNSVSGAHSSHLTLSVLTHCLSPLPLKQTTKAHCKELTPY